MSAPPRRDPEKVVTADEEQPPEEPKPSASDRVTMSEFAEAERLPIQQAFDISAKGRITNTSSKKSVIGALSGQLLQERKHKNFYKKYMILGVVAVGLTLAALFGLLIWALDIMQETQMNNGAMVVKGSESGEIVQTATARRYLGLRYSLVLPMKYLQEIDEISYTFVKTHKKVISKVDQIEQEDIGDEPRTTFTLATGARLVVDPDRFTYMPPKDNVEGQIMDAMHSALSTGVVPKEDLLEFLAEQFEMNKTDVTTIIEDHIVCQGRKGEFAKDDADFELRCNALSVDDPELDVEKLSAKLAEYESRRLLWFDFGCCSTDVLKKVYAGITGDGYGDGAHCALEPSTYDEYGTYGAVENWKHYLNACCMRHDVCLYGDGCNGNDRKDIDDCRNEQCGAGGGLTRLVDCQCDQKCAAEKSDFYDDYPAWLQKKVGPAGDHVVTANEYKCAGSAGAGGPAGDLNCKNDHCHGDIITCSKKIECPDTFSSGYCDCVLLTTGVEVAFKAMVFASKVVEFFSGWR